MPFPYCFHSNKDGKEADICLTSSEKLCKIKAVKIMYDIFRRGKEKTQGDVAPWVFDFRL